MNRHVRWMGAVLLAALPLLSVGCGSKNGTLSGEVTYEGKPVDEGSITLTPADGKGPTKGDKITAGRYTVTDVPPGKKIVKLEAYKKVNFASSSQEMMDRAAEMKRKGNDSGLVEPADVIPNNAQGNNVEIEVKVGKQNQDFHLKKPAAKK